jgi:hypothetical protein
MSNLADNGRLHVYAAIIDRQMEAVQQLSMRRRENDSVFHARANARAMFFDALYRVAPQVSGDLIRAMNDGLLQRAAEALMNEQLGKIKVVSVERSQEDLTQLIADWQNRHALTDVWFQEVALNTLLAAYARSRFAGAGPFLDDGIPLVWTRQDATATPVDGKAGGTLVPVPGESLHVASQRPEDYVDIVITLGDLEQLSDEPSTTWSDGTGDSKNHLGTFNPRMETIDDAVKRLRPALESRLRYALGVLAKRDRELPGATAPLAIRSPIAFERLVRYQVLGESRNSIAKADDVSRATVTQQVNEKAALIGLTLRESRGGRPLNIA